MKTIFLAFKPVFYRRAVAATTIVIASLCLIYFGCSCSAIKKFNSSDTAKKIGAIYNLTSEINQKYNLVNKISYRTGTFNGVRKKRVVVAIETSKTENELKDEIKGIAEMVRKTPALSDCDDLQIVLTESHDYGVLRTAKNNPLMPIPIKGVKNSQNK
jgi:hypothetical protein